MTKFLTRAFNIESDSLICLAISIHDAIESSPLNFLKACDLYHCVNSNCPEMSRLLRSP